MAYKTKRDLVADCLTRIMEAEGRAKKEKLKFRIRSETRCTDTQIEDIIKVEIGAGNIIETKEHYARKDYKMATDAEVEEEISARLDAKVKQDGISKS